MDAGSPKCLIKHDVVRPTDVVYQCPSCRTGPYHAKCIEELLDDDGSAKCYNDECEVSMRGILNGRNGFSQKILLDPGRARAQHARVTAVRMRVTPSRGGHFPQSEPGGAPSLVAGFVLFVIVVVFIGLVSMSFAIFVFLVGSLFFLLYRAQHSKNHGPAFNSSSARDSRFCLNCGRPFRDESKYCLNCGRQRGR